MLHQFQALRLQASQFFLGLIMLFSSSAFAANPLSITTMDPKPVVAGNRSIFMNGVDISSARNQDLRNVHIRISENGDIFITAPQYQVTEEETYTPLSSYVPGQSRPVHQGPAAMGSEKSAGADSSDGPTIAPTVTPNTPSAKAAQPTSLEKTASSAPK